MLFALLGQRHIIQMKEIHVMAGSHLDIRLLNNKKNMTFTVLKANRSQLPQ